MKLHTHVYIITRQCTIHHC